MKVSKAHGLFFNEAVGRAQKIGLETGSHLFQKYKDVKFSTDTPFTWTEGDSTVDWKITNSIVWTYLYFPCNSYSSFLTIRRVQKSLKIGKEAKLLRATTITVLCMYVCD